MARITSGVRKGVELDLLEAGIVIAADDGAAGVGRFGDDVAERFLTAGIDETGEQQTRAEGVPLVDRVALGDEVVEFAAAIARGGDAGGEQRRTELDAGEMRVHLP
jgi:hypothetical protein